MASLSVVAPLPGAAVRLAAFRTAGLEVLSISRAGMMVSCTSELCRPNVRHGILTRFAGRTRQFTVDIRTTARETNAEIPTIRESTELAKTTDGSPGIRVDERQRGWKALRR